MNPKSTRLTGIALVFVLIGLLISLCGCTKTPLPEWSCIESTKIEQNGRVTDHWTDLTVFPGETPDSLILGYIKKNIYCDTIYRNGIEVITTKHVCCNR
jgi:hypothetical protein